VAQEAVRAGLVDELALHVVPVLFGAGTRLFEDLGTQQIELEPTEVVASPAATHLRFRVMKQEPIGG
jgi:riboflavin biosynthesis pyrimidine reductase